MHITNPKDRLSGMELQELKCTSKEQKGYNITLPQTVVDSFARFLLPEIRKHIDKRHHTVKS